MAPNALVDYYESTGGRYRMSSTRRNHVCALLRRSVERMPAGQVVRILDIGIGSGEIPIFLKQTLPERLIQVTGIDISARLVEAKRELYHETRVINVDEDGWQRSFSHSFDIVVASELVEHLFRPDIFFQRLRDVVRADGYVVLSTPNMLLWSQRIKFMLGRHAFADGGVFEWGHIHLFSWPFLQKLIAQNHFRIVDSNHLLHPNFLNPLQRLAPGLLAFQFIVLLQKQ